MNLLDNSLEKEANDFAGEVLIPSKEYENFKYKNISEESIKQFALEIGIHPGIVVGRLQHDKIISVQHFNGLKEQYKIVY